MVIAVKELIKEDLIKFDINNLPGNNLDLEVLGITRTAGDIVSKVLIQTQMEEAIKILDDIKIGDSDYDRAQQVKDEIQRFCNSSIKAEVALSTDYINNLQISLNSNPGSGTEIEKCAKKLGMAIPENYSQEDIKQELEYHVNGIKEKLIVANSNSKIDVNEITAQVDRIKIQMLEAIEQAGQPAIDFSNVKSILDNLFNESLSVYERLGLNKITRILNQSIDLTSRDALERQSDKTNLLIDHIILNQKQTIYGLLKSVTDAFALGVNLPKEVEQYFSDLSGGINDVNHPLKKLDELYSSIKSNEERIILTVTPITKNELVTLLKKIDPLTNTPYQILGVLEPTNLSTMHKIDKIQCDDEIKENYTRLKEQLETAKARTDPGEEFVRYRDAITDAIDALEAAFRKIDEHANREDYNKGLNTAISSIKDYETRLENENHYEFFGLPNPHETGSKLRLGKGSVLIDKDDLESEKTKIILAIENLKIMSPHLSKQVEELKGKILAVYNKLDNDDLREKYDAELKGKRSEARKVEISNKMSFVSKIPDPVLKVVTPIFTGFSGYFILGSITGGLAGAGIGFLIFTGIGLWVAPKIKTFIASKTA